MTTVHTAPIDKTHELETHAASSYKRMIAAGMPAGDITRATATEAEQLKLYKLYKAGKGNFALPPDKSNHVKGLAVDFADDPDDKGSARDWVAKHGAPYGWVQDKNEAWHFDYVLAKDTKRAAIIAAAKRKTARDQVKRVQKVLGLKTDGIPGPKTAAAWNALVKAAK